MKHALGIPLAATALVGLVVPAASAQGNVATIYQCDNGAKVLATLLPDKKIALITAGEDSYRLKTTPSASGVKYVAGPISFSTQKNRAIFEHNGAATKCRKLP